MAKPRQIAQTEPEWFKDRLKDRQLSLRGASRMLDMDPAAFHHMIYGRRKMSVSEANSLSKLLGVDQGEVLKRAGAGQASEMEAVEIIYNIDSHGHLTNKETTASIPAPGDIGHGTKAARCEDPHSLRYGWVYYFEPSAAAPKDFTNSLCVVEAEDGFFVAILLPGFETNRFNLATEGGTIRENVVVRSVAPVSWVKTSRE